jgi:LemA protein
VRDYNTKIETVPTNIIASIFNFATREFFELDEAEKESAKNPVKVEF